MGKYRYIEFNDLKLNCDYNYTDQFEYNDKNRKIKRYRVDLSKCDNVKLPFLGGNNVIIKNLIVGYEPQKDIKNVSINSSYMSNKIVPFQKKIKENGEKQSKNNEKPIIKIDDADLFCDYINTDIDEVTFEKFYEGTDDVDFFKGKRFKVNLKNCETSIPSENEKLTNIFIDKLSLDYIPDKDKIDISPDLNINDKIAVLKARNLTIEDMIKNEKSERIIYALEKQIEKNNKLIKLYTLPK